MVGMEVVFGEASKAAQLDHGQQLATSVVGPTTMHVIARPRL